MAGGGDKEQNYWPGFVDALSNVVLTLIFVLVVFVFALALVANKAKNAVERIVEQRVEEERTKMSAQTTSASTDSKGGASDSTALAEDSGGIELVAKGEEKKLANRGVVKVNSTANEVTLAYPQFVLEMDDASLEKLRGVLGAHSNIKSAARVEIRSYVGGEAFSLAQRLAYYRAIKIRNMLIEEGFVEASHVSSRILTSGGEEEFGKVQIIFTK